MAAHAQEHYDQHLLEALALPEAQVRVCDIPLGVYVREVGEMVALALSRWEPSTQGPGAFRTVAKLYPHSRAMRLQSLALGLQYADQQTNLLGDTRSTLPALKERAERLYKDLSKALTVLLDDGVEDDADANLARVKAQTRERRSAAGAGQALGLWATFARQHLDRLALLEDFNPAWVAEAEALSRELMSLTPPPDDFNAKLDPHDVRDRFFTLVDADLRALQAKARYVFRDEPETSARFVSEHRRQLLKARRPPTPA